MPDSCTSRSSSPASPLRPEFQESRWHSPSELIVDQFRFSWTSNRIHSGQKIGYLDSAGARPATAAGRRPPGSQKGWPVVLRPSLFHPLCGRLQMSALVIRRGRNRQQFFQQVGYLCGMRPAGTISGICTLRVFRRHPGNQIGGLDVGADQIIGKPNLARVPQESKRTPLTLDNRA
jgi:hypothetical protein